MPLLKKTFVGENLKSITTEMTKIYVVKIKEGSTCIEGKEGKLLFLHSIIHQQSLCGKCLDMLKS